MHMRGRVLLLVLSLIATHPSGARDSTVTVLTGATVYPSPDTAAIHDAIVITSAGKITAVGQRGTVSIPAGSRIIDCSGQSIVAGFWNSHVHFTEPVWNQAATAPAATLQKHMQEMLTRWGFTTVWDVGSDPNNSLALRRRVDSGEIKGPRILLAGAIYPLHGHPVYLPAEVQLPEAATPQQAASFARASVEMHLEGIKLFTGAFMGDAPVVNMSTDIVKAAVEVAHSHGEPVFAHPQNRIGLDNAITGGVDVLTHTIPDPSGYVYSPEELSLFKKQHTAMTATLTLWTTVTDNPAQVDGLVRSGVAQLHAFSANSGAVLFGTDVGFINHYDTSQELEFMRRALSAREVLASLTTTPASYFKAAKKGRVAVGFDADLAVLEGDPDDVRNLAKVVYTIRGGQIIFQRERATEQN